MHAMFHWSIADAVCLQSPVTFSHAGYGVLLPKWPVFGLTLDSVDTLKANRTTGLNATVADVLASWLARGDIVDQTDKPNSVMKVPYPISVLACLGFWNCVAMHRQAR